MPLLELHFTKADEPSEVCDQCKAKSAEVEYSALYGTTLDEEAFDENGFCCLVCAATMLLQESAAQVQIEATGGDTARAVYVQQR